MFAIISKFFSGFFASVSDICFMCFVYLLCMLQLLHLNVSKVDWGLPMGCVWEAADGAGDVRGRVGDVWGGVGNV
jgi:phosphotransferase system  glucose/maltose/N-acetylglucosamine-specific IIC component